VAATEVVGGAPESVGGAEGGAVGVAVSDGDLPGDALAAALGDATRASLALAAALTLALALAARGECDAGAVARGELERIGSAERVAQSDAEGARVRLPLAPPLTDEVSDTRAAALAAPDALALLLSAALSEPRSGEGVAAAEDTCMRRQAPAQVTLMTPEFRPTRACPATVATVGIPRRS
jgi:hypothetical protein